MISKHKSKKDSSIKPSFPAFDSTKYEIRNRKYCDTGGGCTVGVIEFYLPEIDKTVWVGCTADAVCVYSADFFADDNCDKFDDIIIFATPYEDKLPNNIGIWLPVITESLMYTIEQEIDCFPNETFNLPVVWLPDTIRKNASPEYLAWLQKQDMWASIGKGGIIIVDDGYDTKLHSEDSQ